MKMPDTTLSLSKKTTAERLKKIALLICDCDGTLTNGGVYYDKSGAAMKRFDVRDGMGLVKVIEAGIPIWLITGDSGDIAKRRAEHLGFAKALLGVRDKHTELSRLLPKAGYTWEQVMFIGDDLNDVQAMEAAGVAACPADAIQPVRELCHLVAQTSGGYGAVRELCNILLTEHGNPIS